MGSGLTLVFISLLSAASPRAIYSSALPVCDADGLTDEQAEMEERDAVEAERAISLVAQPGAPLLAADYARLCSEPQAPSASSVSCSDVRASLWVNRMNGSCQPMKSRSTGHVVLRPARGAGDRTAVGFACDGDHCWREPIPLRAASRDDDGRQPGITSRIDLHLHFPASRMAQASAALPASAPRRKNERPPKA